MSVLSDGSLRWWLGALEDAPPVPDLPAALPLEVLGERTARVAIHGVDDAHLGVALAGVLARYANGGSVVVTVATGSQSWTPLVLDFGDDPDADTALARWHEAAERAAAHPIDLADLVDVAGGRAALAVAIELGGARWPLAAPPVLTLRTVGADTVDIVVHDGLPDADAVATVVAGHLAAVLADWHAATRLSQVALLSAAERGALNTLAWGTALALPDATVWDLVAAAAERTPDAEAVVDDDARLSYRALVERVVSLASDLAQRGIGPGELVGVGVPRSVDMVVALLAIMRSGAAYVPIDPDYPSSRIAMMVEDAKLRFVVARSDQGSTFGEVEHIAVDAQRATVTGEAALGDPLAPVPPAGLAYVIFTSGSTGRPKGVMIGHRALLNFVLAIAERPGLDAGDRLLAVTTLSFDIAALELLVPLSRGGCVVVASAAATIDPQALADRLRDEHVNVMQATPATWRMLLDSGWAGDPDLRVLCGGEALPAALAARLVGRCRELWNMYGPTETTIWSLATAVEPDAPITIGAPLANTGVFVTDDRQVQVPIGVPGELLIAGAGLADGYLGRADLTAERFVQRDLGDGPTRLYRTGDLVRRHADGRLEFIGRLDNQVKVRGFRIECGEVETALEADPDVAQAIAIVRPARASGVNQLIGYVVLEPGSQATATQIRRRLAGTLPDYMVPSVVSLLERFPRTLNGKVDRGALPEPDLEAGRAEATAPRTPLETDLLTVWRDVLDLPSIGVDDDLHDLGVDSLTMARLFAAVGRTTGLALSPATSFEAPTVARLAALVEARRSSAGRSGSGHSGRGHAGNRSGTAPASLVPVRVDASGPGLFLVHGGAGTVLLFEPLARGLADLLPVYAFQAAGLLGDRAPHGSVRQMARAYVAEMRQVQPHGPYRLGGYCYGALVAFEMARLLSDAGETTELLISFNGPSPSYIRRHHPKFDTDGALEARARAAAESSRHERRTLTRALASPSDAPHAARLLAKHAKLQVDRRRRRLRRDAELLGYVVRRRPLPDRLRESVGFQRLSEFAQARYRPRGWHGNIVVVAADGLYRSPDLGWQAHTTGAVSAVTVGGDQITPRQTMTDEFVTPAVTALRARINDLTRG